MLEEDLKRLIIKKYSTVKDFAQAANIPYSTLDSILKRGIYNANIQNIIKLCTTLNLDIDALSKGEIVYSTPEIKKSPTPNEGAGERDSIPDISNYGTPYIPTHRIPILGHISAGLPLYAEEHIEGYTFTNLNSGGEYFALRVRGDSMSAARIMDGDILVVRRQDVVDNGEIAVVLVGDDNATVKRFYQAGRVVTLAPQSANPDHAPQIYDLSATSIRVLGKVVQSQISF